MRLLIKRMLRTQLARPYGIPVPNVLASLFVLLLVFGGGLSLAMMEHTRNADVVYDDFYENTNLADLSASVDQWPYPAEDMLAACAEEMETHPILACETRYIHREKFALSDGDQIPAAYHGIETVDGAFGSISTVWIQDGEGRTPNNLDEVVIDRHMVDELGITLGEEVDLILNGNTVTKTVVGYGNHPGHLWYVADQAVMLPGEGDFAVVYMPIEALLDALDQAPNNRTVMLIDVEGTPDYDLQDTDEVEGEVLTAMAKDISAALGRNNASAMTVDDRSAMWSVELLRLDIEGNRKSLPLFTGILVGVSALVIAISQDRLVRKQSREIAVLTSLGTPSNQILLSYLSVPLAFGTIGGVLAVFAGRAGSVLLTSWYFNDMVGVPVTTIHHHTDYALITFASVFLITVIAGFFPAWRATRLKPLDVMRGATARKPTAVMQVLTGWLPTTIGLGIRSTFRRPVRLGTTVVALGMALVMVGGTMIMFGSMQDWFRENLGEDDTWDVRATYDIRDDDELLAWTDAHPENEYEWSFIYPVNPDDDERELLLHMVESFGTDGESSMHVMRLVEGDLPRPGQPVHEAVLDQGAAKFLSVEIGDEMDLQLTANGAIRVKIVGTVDEMTRSVWVHHSDVLSEVEERFGPIIHELDLELNNTVHIRGENLKDSGLHEIDGLILTDREETIETFNEAWKRQSAGMYIFLAIGWLIALAVLINTLMINLTEHDNEFATLRVLGASSLRLSGILLVESLVIGLIGGTIGALASIATAVMMAEAFTTWMWTFPVIIDPFIVAQIIGMIVLFSVCITPIGLWRVWRMDLVETAKEYAE
jgi:putative ABC transport system permease protein